MWWLWLSLFGLCSCQRDNRSGRYVVAKTGIVHVGDDTTELKYSEGHTHDDEGSFAYERIATPSYHTHDDNDYEGVEPALDKYDPPAEVRSADHLHKSGNDLYKEDLEDYYELLHDLQTEKAASLFAGFFYKDEEDGLKGRHMRKYGGDDELDVEQPLLLHNDTLSYQVLRTSPHGRQLLLITLLEGFGVECWKPRCHGYLEMFLPSLLRSPHQPNPSPNACMLRNIEYNGKTWSRKDVLDVYNNIEASKVKRHSRYSRFRPDDVKSVNSLVMLGLRQENFDSLISLLTVIKDVANPRVFAEAVIKIIHARRDTGFVVPSLRSINPEDYFPQFTGNNSRSGRQFRSRNALHFSFRTTHRTLPLNDPEWNFWYLREDSLVNTMHAMWHTFLSDPNADFIMRRRGELFYYMHKQMLNRYSADRLAVGLEPVQPYSEQDWTSRSSLRGYNSRLSSEIAPGVLYYSPRRPGGRMTRRQANRFRNVARRIRRSIQQGRANGRTLGYSNGVDHGISPLGDIVEPFPSIQTTFLHNQGHVVISEMSEPTRRRGDQAGVMGFVNTAMRDPAFYRWHKYADLIFDFYKAGLGPYRNHDLDFPGVTVSELSLTSVGRRRNVLRTFVESVNMELDENLLRTLNGVQLRYERLNHDDVTMNIRLHSNVREDGIVRVFLIPNSHINSQDMISVTIEMDRFYVQLRRGEMNIRRRLEDSPFFTRGAPDLSTLQDRFLRGMTEIEFNYANCGWPLELAIPRGNSNGQTFSLVAIVTRLLPGERQSIDEWRSLNEISWGWCGVRAGDGSMPDRRPMGFPFDRPTTLREIIGRRSNARRQHVTIFHVAP